MNPKNILMIVGDYVEDYEVMVPFPGPADVGPYRSCRPAPANAPGNMSELLFTISRAIRPTVRNEGIISL